MNKQEYRKLENLGVSMEHLISMIEAAEHMLGEVICGDVGDDEVLTETYLNRLWGMMNGMVELAHNRDHDISELLHIVTVLKEAPEQSARG